MVNISFFSYKGGAGRTSLLLNTLPFLAEKLGASNDEPIVVLDLDLDSKGLSYLSGDAENTEINAIQVLENDVSLRFQEQWSTQEHPFFKNLKPLGKMFGFGKDKYRSILFVTARPKEGHKSLGENGSNYDFASNALFALSRFCRAKHCKAIVMDCPAGDQISAKASLSIANKIVFVMRITQQFRLGTEEFLREKSKTYAGKEYIIVPNAVPDPKGTNFNVEKMLSNIGDIARNSVDENNGTVNLSLLEKGGIKEVNRFKFLEECLKTKSDPLTEDEASAVKMYKLLAEELANVNS